MVSMLYCPFWRFAFFPLIWNYYECPPWQTGDAVSLCSRVERVCKWFCAPVFFQIAWSSWVSHSSAAFSLTAANKKQITKKLQTYKHIYLIAFRITPEIGFSSHCLGTDSFYSTVKPNLQMILVKKHPLNLWSQI